MLVNILMIQHRMVIKDTSFARGKESVRSQGFEQECKLVLGRNALGDPKGMRLKLEMSEGLNAFTPTNSFANKNLILTSESMSRATS